MMPQVNAMDEIAPHTAVEIQHFFNVYKALEAKQAETKGWKGAPEARRAILDCRQRYVNKGERR